MVVVVVPNGYLVSYVSASVSSTTARSFRLCIGGQGGGHNFLIHCGFHQGVGTPMSWSLVLKRHSLMCLK